MKLEEPAVMVSKSSPVPLLVKYTWLTVSKSELSLDIGITPHRIRFRALLQGEGITISTLPHGLSVDLWNFDVSQPESNVSPANTTIAEAFDHSDELDAQEAVLASLHSSTRK